MMFQKELKSGACANSLNLQYFSKLVQINFWFNILKSNGVTPTIFKPAFKPSQEEINLCVVLCILKFVTSIVNIQIFITCVANVPCQYPFRTSVNFQLS